VEGIASQGRGGDLRGAGIDGGRRGGPTTVTVRTSATNYATTTTSSSSGGVTINGIPITVRILNMELGLWFDTKSSTTTSSSTYNCDYTCTDAKGHVHVGKANHCNE